MPERKKGLPGSGRPSAMTTPWQERLEDFWYNHLHNEHQKEEPKEDQVEDKDDLPPQRGSILLWEELPVQTNGGNR